jgi:glycosyltransferase EpsF
MPSPTFKQDKRVLHVITVLSVGGVEVWLIELLRHMRKLKENGVETESFEILMTGGQRHELDDLAESLGASLHYIPFSRRHFLHFAKRFQKLLRDREYTAIHDHQDYSSGWHLIAGAGALPPVRIVHVHNAPARLRESGRTAVRRRLLRLSAKAIKRYATHVLGTSSQILRQYGFDQAAYTHQEVRALHCGFDTSRFSESPDEANNDVCAELGWPPGSKIVLFVGRLDAFKNAEFAINVVRSSIAKGCDLRLMMVGGGEQARELLEQSVKSSGNADRIHLAGRRLDIPRLMAASHCFLFPSLEEGLGMVAVEAQASGLAVIASDTVSREASVISGLVTFLPLSAGVDAWAGRLCEVIAAPRADAEKSNEIVSRSSFSIESSYSALHSVYES